MDNLQEKLQQEEKQEGIEEQNEKQEESENKRKRKKCQKNRIRRQFSIEEEIKGKLNLSDTEQTDLEIAWCIKQIKLGLTQKLTPEEIKISMSMIELLESDQVPLVKKRMTMKSNFGDYRKLMKQYK